MFGIIIIDTVVSYIMTSTQSNNANNAIDSSHQDTRQDMLISPIQPIHVNIQIIIIIINYHKVLLYKLMNQSLRHSLHIFFKLGYRYITHNFNFNINNIYLFSNYVLTFKYINTMIVIVHFQAIGCADVGVQTLN